MSPSIWQILIVVGIFALLFLGPKKIPGFGKSLGQAIRGFKKGINEDEIDVTHSQEQIDESEQSDSQTEKSKKSEKV